MHNSHSKTINEYVNMYFYFGIINIIFCGLYKSIQSQNICDNEGDLLLCCSNYHIENGECIACPYGSFGVNCSESCPKGFFGEFCAKVCNCSDTEICDVAHGCMDNTTEEISEPQFKTEFSMVNLPTTGLTVDATTEPQDIESRAELPTFPLFLYFVSAGCASLLCVICSLAICRTLKRTRGVIKQDDPSTSPPSPPPQLLEPGCQDIPLLGVPAVHAEASGSDYAQIRECNHAYSSCAEASSVYNVLSFSRSKYRSETFNTVSGIYSTSKSCSLQKKEAIKLESKSDETDNTQVDPIDLVAIMENSSEDDQASKG